MEVFRIIDRFQITGRGTVYMVKLSKDAAFHVGDILFDLQGNRFNLKGTEMIRRLISDISFEELPVGILLEPLDGCDAKGNLFIKSLTDVNFLFCNHPLYSRKVDEDYEEEYQAASLDHPCALFSYEDFRTDKLSLYGEEISGLTIYRGWMMKPEMYRNLYLRLEEKGIILINSPKEYEMYHMLPGWYNDFSKETAFSVWTSGNDIEDVINLVSKLDAGSYVVKDYVKSRKHEWYNACFIQNIEDKAAVKKIVGNFIDGQRDDLVGGVVLRKFESLRKAGFHPKSGMPISEEYRVFIYAGRILAIDDYWETKSDSRITDEEYKWIESIAERVKSNFVTVDIARKEDGSLIIMEFGDGQVSGLQQLKEDEFYRTFRRVGICNPYSIEDIKRTITTFTKLDIEPELSLTFLDKKAGYMIIGYIGHVSFQRCGCKDGSGEIDYPDLDTLFSADLIDGICLSRDWYKVSEVWCQPDMTDMDAAIEAYRIAAENRKGGLGDRYHIYKAVKAEIDKWNLYRFLLESPHGKFNSESESVARKIKYDSSVEKIAKTISRVFSEAFEPEYFPVEVCMDVAEKIKAALEESWGN